MSEPPWPEPEPEPPVGAEPEGPVRSVAFVRNLNQGQRGHVSTADLLAAFVDVGCADPTAVQSNGTVVFSGAATAARTAIDLLATRTGVERDVFVLPLDEVAAVVSAHRDAPDADRRELTLHAPLVVVLDGRAVQEATRRRCRILQVGRGWTVTVNERDRESNATPVLERLTGAPATSRGMPTMVRLVDRSGPPTVTGPGGPRRERPAGPPRP